MALWVEAGQPADRFWHLTPKEIDAVLRGVGAMKRREQNERAWLAWHIVALGRVKKMPNLDKMMVGPPKPKDAGPNVKDAEIVRGYLMALAMRGDQGRASSPRRTNGRATGENSPAGRG